jgi:hypothetical protein
VRPGAVEIFCPLHISYFILFLPPESFRRIVYNTSMSNVLTFGRIGRRLLAWFLIIALIPLLFMGFQGYDSARRAIETEASLHMQAVAATKVSQISMWFSERLSDIEILNTNPRLRSSVASLGADNSKATAESIVSELESFKSRIPAYDNFCLFDAAGKPLCCTQVGVDSIPDFNDPELFSRAKNSSKPQFSSIHLQERIGADCRTVHG